MLLSQKIASSLRDLISRPMKRLENDLAHFAHQQTGFLRDITSYVLSSEGKRLRPALVFLMSGFGRADEEHVQTVAMSVELIHIATLIHDDLVDQATIRRQKPTVAVRFGSGASVLLGDFVYANAFRRLAALQRPELVSYFAETTSTMCEGEIAQLERRHRFDTRKEEYLSFIFKKTASLMAVSARAGAEMAGLSREHVHYATCFGEELGMAFQIRDDLLDITGNEDHIGKTLRTDLKHGKMTLPLIHLRENLDKDKKLELENFVRNPDDQMDRIVNWMKEEGSLQFSANLARQYASKAVQLIQKVPANAHRDALIELIDSLFSRV